MGHVEEASGSDDDGVELLSVSWNQDNSCFIAATTNGFRVFSCKPFHETMRRMFGPNGGIGIAEMLFRTSIFGLAGAESNTEFPPTMLQLWDDYNERRIHKYNFTSEIRAVRLSKDYFVVVLEKTINVYRFKDLRLFYQARTVSNPNGLCCLSHHANASVFACPGTSKGQVLIEHFGLKETRFIAAHDSPLSCMTMALDGTLLATASVRGTLIRIFNTRDGTCVQEVRLFFFLFLFALQNNLLFLLLYHCYVFGYHKCFLAIVYVIYKCSAVTSNVLTFKKKKTVMYSSCYLGAERT